MVAVAASGSGGGSLVPAWGALCCVHHVGTAMAGEGRALQARLELHSKGGGGHMKRTGLGDGAGGMQNAACSSDIGECLRFEEPDWGWTKLTRPMAATIHRLTPRHRSSISFYMGPVTNGGVAGVLWGHFIQMSHTSGPSFTSGVTQTGVACSTNGAQWMV